MKQQGVMFIYLFLNISGFFIHYLFLVPWIMRARELYKRHWTMQPREELFLLLLIDLVQLNPLMLLLYFNVGQFLK